MLKITQIDIFWQILSRIRGLTRIFHEFMKLQMFENDRCVNTLKHSQADTALAIARRVNGQMIFQMMSCR